MFYIYFTFNYYFILNCIKKRPKLSLLNGLDFPPIPKYLKHLSNLEERFVSARIPFMNIRPMGNNFNFFKVYYFILYPVYIGLCQQDKLKGNVVNVPVSVPQMISHLPRYPSETETIQVKLMRKNTYKQPYMFESCYL